MRRDEVQLFSTHYEISAYRTSVITSELAAGCGWPSLAVEDVERDGRRQLHWDGQGLTGLAEHAEQ